MLTKGGVLMIDIKALCKQCANKGICKYTKQLCNIYETIEIEYPFSVEIKCKYFKNIASGTDGM